MMRRPPRSTPFPYTTLLRAANPTATDNCDASPTITYAEVRTDGNCPQNYSLNRTWISNDSAATEICPLYLLAVLPTCAPVLHDVPADTTVQCDAVPAAANPTATDNCHANPTITYAADRTDCNCPQNYSLKRTWTAKDCAGNESSQSQIITVHDTSAPVLHDVPADTTVQCDAVTAAAHPSTPVTSASSLPISYSEIRTDGKCPQNYSLKRTWTAKDCAGNESSQSQIVTVRDTTAPVLHGVPADTTVECDAVPAAAEPTATDNCDPAPSISYAEVRTDGNCPQN